MYVIMVYSGCKENHFYSLPFRQAETSPKNVLTSRIDFTVLLLIEFLKNVTKKIIFTACHKGKLKLGFTSPDVISTSPKNVLTSRNDFTVLLLIEFLKKHHLPIGQVKNRTH